MVYYPLTTSRRQFSHMQACDRIKDIDVIYYMYTHLFKIVKDLKIWKQMKTNFPFFLSVIR